MKTLKYIPKYWLILLLLIAHSFSCSKTEEQSDTGGSIDDRYHAISIKPTSGTRIAWDFSSLQQLASSGQAPQMIRLSETALLVVYEAENNIFYRKTDDNGETWSAPKVLFEKYNYKGKDGSYDITFTDLMSNPSIIRLKNGDILASCAVYSSYKLSSAAAETIFPSGILVRKIGGNSFNLQPVKEVYRNLGCDHPALIELPNGDLHLYFTNGSSPIETETLKSTGLNTTIAMQQIEMIRSEDGGTSWSGKISSFGPDGIEKRWTGATIIAHRYDKNNRNPSVEILGNELVVAFSDNKMVNYKPYTVRSPLTGIWPFTINGDTPEREYALYEKLPDNHLMDSPALIKLPSGATLLSYHTNAQRQDGAETMEVAVGTQHGTNFTNYSRPFGFTNTNKAIDNSLLSWSEHTIAALSSSNYHNTKEDIAPWLIKGHLINELAINNQEVSEFPLFIGGISASNLYAGIRKDANNLYVHARVTDGTPMSSTTGKEDGDGIYVYIDAPNLSLRDVDAGITKFWVSSGGDIIRWDGFEGNWKLSSSDDSSIVAVSSKTAEGYTLKLTIPTNKLTNFNPNGIRFGIGLKDQLSSEESTNELLTLCEDLRSSTWLGVTF